MCFSWAERDHEKLYLLLWFSRVRVGLSTSGDVRGRERRATVGKETISGICLLVSTWMHLRRRAQGAFPRLLPP